VKASESLSKSVVLLAIVSGAVGALGAATFREALFALERLLHGNAGHLVAAAQALSWWQRLLFPCLGGIAAGIVLHLGARWIGSENRIEYLEAIALERRRVDTRSTLLRSSSSLISVATGASIGREGAMVQVAAVAGHQLNRVIPVTDQEYRSLIACAAAAGLATAYNAPLASALFVGEVALSAHALPQLVPVLLAAVTGNAIAQLTFGATPIFAADSLDIGSLWMVPAWIAVGAISGGTAPLFVRLLGWARDCFARMSLTLPVQLGLGGALVGAMSVVEPRIWGNGYSVIDDLLHQPWTVGLLAQVLLLKIFATAATAGSGAVGGVFTPTLLVGACIGQLVWIGAQLLVPEALLGTPMAYAALGMGALLAATTHAPMMAILMILEMTGHQPLTLPLAVVCATGYIVARAARSPSIYAESLSRAAQAGSRGDG